MCAAGGLAHNRKIASVTKQTFNPVMSKCWTTGQSQLHLNLMGHELEQAKTLRSLGANLRFKRGIKNELGAKRVE